MSTLLATAANLATDVAAWLSRADLTADIPTMIVLAEAKLNRLLRSLEHEVRNPAFMLAGEYVPAPLDFLEFKSGYVNGSPKVPIYYMPEDFMPNVPAGDSAMYITMSGTNFRFAPPPDGSATASISYFAKLPTLSGVGVQTNWLLAQHPDAYLYGTLLEASGRIQDASLMQGWQTAYEHAVRQIIDADRRKRYGANGMTIRTA